MTLQSLCAAMLVLGIETSGKNASIALLRDDDCMAQVRLEAAGRRHAQTLVAEIDRLLRGQGLRVRDCEAVAVSVGPGSFTGLRIGIMCAKTLAYATGCPLAAVDTLLAIAENSPADVDEVYVVSDAQRRQWYARRYRRAGTVFAPLGDVAIVDAEPWCAERVPGDVVTGPAADAESLLSNRCRLLAAEFREPHAHTIAHLGRAQLQMGMAADPWRLEPIYVRRSAAEEKGRMEDGG
jgi:tRNA threonylcarbamoyladenosine biosynthesis protein TsaB